MKSFTLNKIKPERDMPHTSSVRGITKTEGNQSPFIQLSGQTIQYLGRFYNLQSGDKLGHLFPGNWEIGITFLDDYTSKRWLPGPWGNIPELWDRPEAYLATMKIYIHWKRTEKEIQKEEGEGENLSAYFQRGENLYLPLHLFQHLRMSKGFPGSSDSKVYL